MSGSLHPFLAVVVLAVCLGVSGCRAEEGGGGNAGTVQIGPSAVPLPEGFSGYYQPLPVEVTPQASGYDLPLDWGRVANAESFTYVNDAQRDLLTRHGFVLLGAGRSEDIADVYEGIEDSGDPVWVTPDAVLHSFHIQFNETLKTVEETQLIPIALRLSEQLQQASLAQYNSFDGDLKEAARRNLAFFSIGRQLLDAKVSAPGAVSELVREEMRLIEAHAGFSDSPLFTYKEDYSQYLPRGHYTRSEPLKAYFKAMMWYGRMGFLLKGKDISGNALVSAEEARRQTLQAALIAALLYQPGAEGRPALADDWRRIYLVTAFFAGFADDLTPYQYAEQIQKVCGAACTWAKLAEPETFVALRDALAALPKPKIYSGAGRVVLLPPFSPEQLDETLADTQGLRLMSQRYTPDSYMFQQLIFPAVGPFTGEGEPFTMVMTPGGPQRNFARGLDVMAVLGSDRALQHLEAGGDTAYGNYDTQMAALRSQFSALPVQDWGRDLYTGWVYVLQALVQPRPEGYPNFMRTPAWEDRQLQAALASWAQLRHDTILYAKQPYPMVAMSAPPPPAQPKSVGFVEPLPEFYGRLLALTNAMRDGLRDLEIMPPGTLNRLQSLASLLQSLVDISVAELSGRPLNEGQEQVIRSFHAYLNEGLHDVDPEGLKTTLVADVLTDPVGMLALEEGSGKVRQMVVAYSDAEGNVFLGRGATLSYYEFKQPIANRLTDEAWRELLAGPDAPPPPVWVTQIGGE